MSKVYDTKLHVYKDIYAMPTYLSYRNMLHRRLFKMLCMALDALL